MNERRVMSTFVQCRLDHLTPHGMVGLIAFRVFVVPRQPFLFWRLHVLDCPPPLDLMANAAQVIGEWVRQRSLEDVLEVMAAARVPSGVFKGEHLVLRLLLLPHTRYV